MTLLTPASLPQDNLPDHRPRWRLPWGRVGGALDGWTLATLGIAALIALPVVTVAAYLLVPAGEVWRHLAATVLPDYIANTVILAVSVGLGVTLIGVGTAWLTSLCRFPGRRIFEWGLLLPMAVPAYVIAYTYTGLLDYPGPVQTYLRDLFGWSRPGDYWFPEIRSLGGAAAMLTLVLYPYVYMLSRAAFLEQSVCVLEVSRTLGCTPWAAFRRVALPLARPAIVGGVALALMETLNDFGTVQYFGVDTFTTGIYRTWLGLGEPAAAAQLAAVLLAMVLVLLAVERFSRRRGRFHHTSGRYRPLPSYALAGGAAFAACAACVLPLLLGFLVPAAALAAWAFETAPAVVDARFLDLARNSFLLAFLSAMLAVFLALILAYGQRLSPSPLLRGATRLAAIGYAIPGAVIAVGVLLPLAAFDNFLDGLSRDWFGIPTGLLFSGTIAALIFAYLVRFLAVSFNTVDAGLNKIRLQMDQAARSLGESAGGTLRRIHAPLLSGSLFTAGLLVFVDVLKELPATLIIRPFNFDTLAIRTYELASDEFLAESAVPALAIVAVGLLPVLILSAAISRARPGGQISTAKEKAVG